MKLPQAPFQRVTKMTIAVAAPDHSVSSDPTDAPQPSDAMVITFEMSDFEEEGEAEDDFDDFDEEDFDDDFDDDFEEELEDEYDIEEDFTDDGFDDGTGGSDKEEFDGEFDDNRGSEEPASKEEEKKD